jgi:kynureninase
VKRAVIYLNAESFTTMSACAREIMEIVRTSELKVIVRANPKQLEELTTDMEGYRTLGRVDVEEIA